MGNANCCSTIDKKQNAQELGAYQEEKDAKSEESALEQQQRVHTQPVSKGAIPDVNLFENMSVVEHCKAFEEMKNEDKSVIMCPAMKRLLAILNYYNSLMVSHGDGEEEILRSQFIAFCDNHYDQKWMLEDHIHLLTNHSDPMTTKNLAARLEWKCFEEFKQCHVTTRHYRNRQRDGKEGIHIYIDMMDSLHFNILHLNDVGLRVNVNLEHESNYDDDDSLVNEAYLRMTREIILKREEGFLERLDGAGKGSKFSLCSGLENGVATKSGMTQMDFVLTDWQKEVGDESTIQNLAHFLNVERYDTETMNGDMAIYEESKGCNLFEAIKGDTATFRSLRQLLRYHRVSGSSFSTGKWWAYWEWYRAQSIDPVINHESRAWHNVDFGGHSLQSLCVLPHFSNLKEEVLASAFVPIESWSILLEKATRFLQTSRCRAMVDPGHGYLLKMGLLPGFKVTSEHLLALFLYTDLSAFCTAFSETFRAIAPDETIEEMNSRNSMYYWTSRYLRELVFCFGERANKEKRLFYTGLSFEMNIPQFQIGLIGPTSCSMVPEVAWRFAGDDGMMIAIKGGYSRFFDASWLSAYPEEQERLFFGSVFREPLIAIVLVNSAKNYKDAIGAYSKFDAIFNGKTPEQISDLEMEIILESLRWNDGGDDAVNHRKLDLYILETFYSFLINKKLVYFHMDHLHRAKDNPIVNLYMNMDTNLMKPLVFNLFRNLHQIRIYTGYHSFDLVEFFEMIQNADIHHTLKLITIESDDDWLDRDFTDKMKTEYSAKGLKIEKEKDAVCWTLKLKL